MITIDGNTNRSIRVSMANHEGSGSPAVYCSEIKPRPNYNASLTQGARPHNWIDLPSEMLYNFNYIVYLN